MRTPWFVRLACVSAWVVCSSTILRAADRPDALREVGFDQHLGESIPMDLRLRDESSREVRLGDFFGHRPVVLSLAYFQCPMLCTLSLNGLSSALDVLSLELGRDFEIVTVSFDPRDTAALAAAKKKTYLERYKRVGAGAAWHFLTGDADAIARLTRSVGFRYAWDERTSQFAHPTGVIVLTADGRIARYLFGIEYAPKDLRLAIVDASGGRVGSPVDALLLFCYQYDPSTGRYGLWVMRLVRVAAVLTVATLAAFVVVMRRRERRL